MSNLTTIEQISKHITEVDGAEIAAKFLDLLTKYDLKFVTYADKCVGQSFFLASDLATSKGLRTSDFADNYSRDLVLTRRLKNVSSDKLPNIEEFKHKFLGGRCYKLTGEALKRFKDRYFELYNIDLGRINSVWVLDWRSGFSYLCQGSSASTKSLTSHILEIGADAVEHVAQTYVKKNRIPEWELLQELWYLIGLAQQPFWKVEPEIQNTIDSRVQSRRFDLVHIQGIRGKPKLVEINELKPDIIHLQDILDKVENCKYLELAKEHYKTDNTKLIFIASCGGTSQAYEYVKNKPEIQIKFLYELVDPLLNKALAQHRINPYFISENVTKIECQKLISVTLEAFKAFKTLRNTLGNNSVLKRLLPS